MKQITMILLLVVGIMFSGCATYFDRDIASENNKTIQNYDTQQKEVAVKKADAISIMFEKITSRCQDNTFACGAVNSMAGALASRDIAGIETKKYDGPMQKTGVDAQIKVAEKAGEITLGIALTESVRKGKGDTTTVDSGGGPITTTKSFNKEDKVGIAGNDVNQNSENKENSDNPDNSIEGEAGTTTP